MGEVLNESFASVFITEKDMEVGVIWEGVAIF